MISGDLDDDINDVNSGMVKMLSTYKLHNLMRHELRDNIFVEYSREHTSTNYALEGDRIHLELTKDDMNCFVRVGGLIVAHFILILILLSFLEHYISTPIPTISISRIVDVVFE